MCLRSLAAPWALNSAILKSREVRESCTCRTDDLVANVPKRPRHPESDNLEQFLVEV